MRIGAKVRLYHPDLRKNGTVKGTIVGGGFMEKGLVYLVELDKEFQGYITSPETSDYQQFISTVIVNSESVMGA